MGRSCPVSPSNITLSTYPQVFHTAALNHWKRHATTLARRACRPGRSSVVMSVSNGTTRAKRIRFNNNNRPALISFCYGELGRAGRGPTLVELDIAVLRPLHLIETQASLSLSPAG